MQPDVQYKKIEFNPFAGPEIEKVAPSTEAQLEMWASVLIGGADASRAYNESVTLNLFGALNIDAFESALQKIINRHEALRSVFTADGKQLCVFKTIEADVHYKDIAALNKKQQQDFLTVYLKQDADKAYNLVRGPLFRIALFKLNEEEHCFIFSAHHIVCDGWSLGIIIRDISRFYNCNQQATNNCLKQAPQFSDYALEQIKQSKNGEQQSTEQYWVDEYKNNVPVVKMPVDFPRPAVRNYKSKRDDYLLEEATFAAIKKLGVSNGCTFVITLVAAFEVYLHKRTQQNEIVLGLPAAGQSISGYYDLVGHCVNLLPLKAIIDDEESFGSYLKKCKSKLLDAFEHQNLTFGSLLKRLNLKRDPSRVPLVPVVLNIDMGLDEGVDFKTLQYRLNYNPRNYETFELFLNIADADNGLRFEWSYNTQLFKPSTIKEMMDEFTQLLKEISANASIKIKDILADDEPDKIIANRLSNKIIYPQKPLHELIDDAAKLYANNIAIQFKEQSISYAELIARANHFAKILLQHNIMPGDRVGLAIDRSVETVVCLLAILKTGAAYVPLDVSFPKERLQYMLQDAEVKVLLTSAHHQHLFKKETSKILIEDIEPDDKTIDATLPEVSPKDLAYVLYTSGSTGKPKGVAVEHRSLVNFLYSMQQQPGIRVDNKLLAITTISFDIAGLEIYLPLISGATIVLADINTTKDGKALLQIINKEKITLMQATPATWQMLIDAGWSLTKNLKVLCGGEALSKNLADKILERCSELWNMYGPTETTVWSAIKKIDKKDKTITVGKPINNTQLYIIDEHKKVLANGEVGEIGIGGDGVARGYFNKPQLTASKFISNKNVSEDRVYLTGDLGMINEDGELVCYGRNDFQIKVRGYRIEAGEVETHLLKLSDVTGVVVAGVKDASEQQKLVAYVTTNDNSVEASALILYWKNKLKAWLPDYMIPSDIIIVPEFPLTLNGKIDRNVLINSFHTAAVQTNVYIAPRNETEQLLANIWSSLINIEKISVTDDFFEIGGHSLIAAQMMAEVEKQTGKIIPLAVMFSNPTIETLATYLQENKKVQSSLVTIKASGSKMPVFIIHGAGLNVLVFNFLAANVDAEQPVYALQAKGLNGVDEPADDIKELAAYYISEILTVSGNGPVALAGYSLGGIIALEMMNQLQAMGRKVNLLAMIDAWADAAPKHEPLYIKLLSKLSRQFGKLWFVTASFLLHPQRTIKYQRTIMKNKMKKFLNIGIPNEDLLVTPLAISIYNRMEAALLRYEIKPFCKKISIFKAKIRAYYTSDQKYLGWQPYAKCGIKIYEVPGDHSEMFDEKNNRIFAQMLQDALDNAANES